MCRRLVHQLASIAKESYELTKQIHAEQSQPYVFADIRSSEHEPQLVVLLIRNQGPTVATDVRVTFSPAIAVDPARPDIGPLSELTVSSLAPGAQIVRACGVGSTWLDQSPDRITITVNGQGPHGTLAPVRHHIDMIALRQSLAAHKTLHHVVQAVEKIAKGVDAITRKLPSPSQ